MSSRLRMIGNRIKQAREDAGLSQKALGAAIDVTQSTIALYESGRRAVTIDMLFQLSRVLGRSVEWFLGLDTDLTDDEDQLLTAYRTIKDDAGKGLALRLLKDMASVE